jgi:hypothetical protein
VFPGNRRIGSPRLGSKLPLNAKEGQVPVARSRPLQLAASLVLFDAASVQKPKPRDAGGALDVPIIEGEGAGGLIGRVHKINPHLRLSFRPNLHSLNFPVAAFLNPRPRLRVLVTYAVGREPSLKGTRMAPRTAKICKRCNHPMETVTNVAPNGSNPGLVTWYCDYCGAADSDLIYSKLSGRLA